MKWSSSHPTTLSRFLKFLLMIGLNVWKLCQQRMKQLATNPEIAWATLFKNGGIQAGASLAHVHSQLIAIDRTPPTISTKCQQVIRQPNLFENILSEAESENRIVHTYKSFVAIVPSAPRQPFEVWLIRNEPSCFLHTEPHSQMEEDCTIYPTICRSAQSPDTRRELQLVASSISVCSISFTRQSCCSLALAP